MSPQDCFRGDDVVLPLVECLSFSNSRIFLLLNGGLLSESWTFRFPYMSFMLANDGITLSPLVEETYFACENLDARSCTTTMCLDDGIGLKKSTAIFSQHFSGTSCSFSSSIVFLSANALHASHFLIKFLTFLSIA